MPAPLQLTGQRFGKLTVLHIAASKNGKRRWACSCECGQATIVTSDKLVSGRTKTCGCARHESNGRPRAFPERGSILKKEPTYRSFRSMHYRCKPSYARAAYYFDRGIDVCERWQSFENFVVDMGWRPAGTTLDRIDVNKNYEPGNCRWASYKTQARNKRRARQIIVNGTPRFLMEVADELGHQKECGSVLFFSGGTDPTGIWNIRGSTT